jgi:hypothetical protein
MSTGVTAIMKFRCFILILMFPLVLVANGNAAVRLYISPPSQASFSSLSIGSTFAVDIMAEADAPGVTLITFRVTWSPGDSVEFIHPMNGGALSMTGFFPPSSASRFSGIMPDSTSESATGSSGSTPEIVVFTAPALNSTGPDSLASVTFRKQSSSYPTFGLSNENAYNGSEISVPTTSQTLYVEVSIDGSGAVMSGPVFSQADAVTVNIGGSDYQANVIGNTWTLDISSIASGISVQQIVVNAMQGGSPVNSFITYDYIRSPGWYVNPTEHSEHPGDSNGDGSTNSADLMILAQAYGSSAGEDRYDFRCDFSADGVADLRDLLIFGLNYR